MSSPLLTAALPGFRAWMVDAAGHLLPYTGQSGAWEPGDNTARCARGSRHVAPHPECTCGIYAFHAVHRQLRGEAVVGAIAAWGDMEIYRDGFRAQHARVVALAGGGARVRAAAERHGVPVVHRATLLALGTIATGALPASLVEGADDVWLARRRGYRSQTWVEASGGVVTFGVSEAMATAVPERLREVEIPVRGRVIERHAAGHPWLARIVPSHWEEDCRRFRWGAAGRAEMLAETARDGDGAWEHLLPGDAPGPRSWREVRELMAQWAVQPPAPRFASAADFYDEVAIPLGQALQQRRPRLETVLAIAVEQPAARVVVDLREGRLHTGRGPTADVEVALSADDFMALVEGRFDLARESRTGRLRVRGSLAHALSCLAIVAGLVSPRRPRTRPAAADRSPAGASPSRSRR